MRKAMEFVKKKFQNQVIVGAEVGVAIGTHALEILENMPNVKLLYLIDPYQHYPEWTSTLAQDRRFWPEDMEIIKNKAKQNLTVFNNKIRWVYKKFEECTYKDIDEPLDFIYINGNHASEYVKKDIELARVLVKNGGVIAGHDFRPESTTNDLDSREVCKAVTEYCESHDISFSHEYEDWWFIN